MNRFEQKYGVKENKAIQDFHMIIILNGSTSSGKSSITQELQKLFDVPYLHAGIDRFFAMMPRQFINNGERAELGIKWIHTSDEHGPLVYPELGLWGKKMLRGMYKSIAALAECDNNVIVDDVILNKQELQEVGKCLIKFKVYFIGVKCSLK